MLFLASRSPRRRQLLRRLGRPFRVVRSTHRERIRRALGPAANAKWNAAGKASKARLPRGARGLVIGADTFLYFRGRPRRVPRREAGSPTGVPQDAVRGRIIGKPGTMAQARRLMRQLSGRSHWVYTGLCVLEIPSGRRRLSCERTKVTFKRLSGEAIARLFARASPLDKAGGYALQADRGGELIARIDGSRTNVIGLPLKLLRRELAHFQ